jgi:glycosyltransferase involved in cell wall biosynthesis
VLTHGIAMRLSGRGHHVDWYAGSFPGALESETIDGIHVHRGGTPLTVRLHAWRFFRKNAPYDVLIDEINTIPFFAPRYARPCVALVCQLAREVWFYETRQPVSGIGFFAEPIYLRPYSETPTLTISRSSARSLREIGFRGEIGVMPMALEQYDAGAPLPLDARNNDIVALGRVTPSKRIDDMIRALSLLPDRYGSCRLRILGFGALAECRRLRKLAAQLGVADRLDWSGYVNEEQKRLYLRHAKALVMTSVREGWGLAVSEANLAGTPAVAYDVAGLCDSVRHERTGYVVPANPRALAEGLVRLFDDRSLYESMARAAQDFAETLTWDATTDYVEQFLKERIP